MTDKGFIIYNAKKAELPVALDDNIMVKGQPATAGSKMLSNFVAPFNATVVEKLEKAGITIVGKTKLDEFGVGRISGDISGTVSGAVLTVAEDVCTLAFANDFSGKIRRQAPKHGLYYIHPTYGTVSRFGLIPSVSSMDQIGVVCKDIKMGFNALSVISGNDKNDGTTYPEKSYKYEIKKEKLKIGLPVNVLNAVDKNNKDAVLEFTKSFLTEEFELEYFNVFAQVQYILGCAEISNNNNRYDGVKFGYRTNSFKDINDLYCNTRTEGFGLDVKLASIMGCIVLSKEYYDSCYLKSMQVRRLIKNSLEEAFKKFDLIALPLGFKENTDPYKESALYAAATLAGLPSVSVPLSNGAGLQLIAKAKDENALFSACTGGAVK